MDFLIPWNNFLSKTEESSHIHNALTGVWVAETSGLEVTVKHRSKLKVGDVFFWKLRI